MKLFPGHIITKQGCTSRCKTTVLEAVDVDSCISICIQAGYAACKAIQFKPAGSFGLNKNECTMFSTGVKHMGAHATAEVLASGGMGAVVADFCEPPPAFAEFPVNTLPDYGIDWESVCSGKEVAVVPGAFLPTKACTVDNGACLRSSCSPVCTDAAALHELHSCIGDITSMCRHADGVWPVHLYSGRPG